MTENDVAPDEEPLTVAEVASSLHLSPRTVTAKLNKGELKGWKTGRRWLIAASELKNYLDSIQPPGITPPAMQDLQRSFTAAAQTVHIGTLIGRLRKLHSGVHHLIGSSQFTVSLTGLPADLRVHSLNGAELASFEQHLRGSSTEEPLRQWIATGETLIRREQSVYEHAYELGEKEFKLPVADRDPDEGGYLTLGVPAVLLQLAIEYEIPKEAASDGRIAWIEGELRFDHSLALVRRGGLSPSRVKKMFSALVKRLVGSDAAKMMRESMEFHSTAADSLEYELDGIDLSRDLPGTCEFCPIRRNA